LTMADRLEATLPSLALAPKEAALKRKLLADGFGDWSRRDFRSFTNGLEQYGRKDRDAVFRQVSAETGKGEAEVERYLDAFNRFASSCLSDYAKVMEKIEKGERKIARQTEIAEALATKLARSGPNAFQTLTVNYGAAGNGGSRGKVWTDEEDAYLVCMMHRHGYGQWERIRGEIRRAWQFKFDWFFKSRNAAELQRRGDVLLRCIEKENEDIAKKEKEAKSKKIKGGDKKKRASLPSPTEKPGSGTAEGATKKAKGGSS